MRWLARTWPLVFFGLLYLTWPTYMPGDSNDDVAYVALARSLARGLPYVNLAQVGEAVHQRFPPGFPLLLSPFQAFFPENLALCRLLVAGLAFLAIGLLFLYQKQLRASEPLVWSWTPWILVTNSFWLTSGVQIMSEQAFFVGLLAYLWLFERTLADRDAPWIRYLSLGVALGVVCSLRSIGTGLLPVSLFYLRRCGWRRWSLYLLGFTLSAGPWLLRSVLTGYDGELVAGGEGALETLRLGLLYVPFCCGWVMFPGLGWLRQWLPDAFGLLPLGVGLLGLWKLRRHSLGLGWVVLAMALLICWPFRFPRLVLPMIPLLQLGFWRICSPVRWPAARILFGALVLGNLWVAVQDANSSRPQKWLDAGAVELLRSLPAKKTAVTTDIGWWLYSGVPCLPVSPQLASEAEWLWLEQVLHANGAVILVPTGPERLWVDLAAYLNRRPWFYHLVYRNGPIQVFAFAPEVRWYRSAACQDLARQALLEQRPDQAEVLFRKALRQTPYDTSAATGLAFTLARLGKSEAASQLANSVLTHDPANGEARRALALSRVRP